MIKTFKGLMADEQIQRIKLSSNNGLIGYKIKKFNMLPEQAGSSDHRFVMKIFTNEQTGTPDGIVNFNNPQLIAASAIEDNGASHYPHSMTQIVIDNKVINQDIYITLKDLSTGESCNYYLELEQIKLSVDEAAVATLKDMRGRE
tara:strand:- start:49 stop:483 length:435 start_codon:yes stop_codon:yes gene_type:complete